MNPANTRPDEPGLYEVEVPIVALRTPTKFYAYWSGVAWSPCSRSRERAMDPLCQANVAVIQNKRWKAIS